MFTCWTYIICACLLGHKLYKNNPLYCHALSPKTVLTYTYWSTILLNESMNR